MKECESENKKVTLRSKKEKEENRDARKKEEEKEREKATLMMSREMSFPGMQYIMW